RVLAPPAAGQAEIGRYADRPPRTLRAPRPEGHAAMLRSALLTLALLPAAGDPRSVGTPADAFDQFTSRDLANVITGDGVLPVGELTAAQMVERAGVLPGSGGALLLVRTGDGLAAKLLVQ